MSVKILFFDVDGTIYIPGRPGLTPAVSDAIHAAQRKGIRCYVASGRPFSAVSQLIVDTGFDGYVLSNGAQLIMSNEQQVRFLPRKELDAAVALLEAQGIHYAIQTDSETCVQPGWDDMIAYYAHYSIFEDKITRIFEKAEKLDLALKLEFVTHTEAQRQAVLAFKTVLGTELHPDGFSMEFNDSGCTKADGVREVISRLGFAREESMAFGDAINDAAMLRECGVGVAMANASDEVKQYADAVCPSVFEDGVAVFLKKQGMI